MIYPKRGEMSEDGKFYTHTDGSVHACSGQNAWTRTCECEDCSVLRFCHATAGLLGDRCGWSLVRDASPSDDEQEACDMARHCIDICKQYRSYSYDDCKTCPHVTNRTCPARAYLAAHGDANAWEVTP